MNGVLASWAIPRGPSYDPRVRRLAVQTEDHPLAYGTFEGRIPEGEYGAGDTLLWDRGCYRTLPPEQADAMRSKGHLTIELYGAKLRGRWHLVRSRSLPGKEPNWLFFKGKDEFADPTFDVVAQHPESVVSGKRLTRGPLRRKLFQGPATGTSELLERVAHSTAAAGNPTDAAGNSTDASGNATDAAGNPTDASGNPTDAAGNPSATTGNRPTRTKASHPRAGMTLAAVSRGMTLVRDAQGHDVSAEHAEVVAALSRLPVVEAVLGGRFERNDRGAIQARGPTRRGETFCVSDLLWLDGEPWMHRSPSDRRDAADSLLANVGTALRLDPRSFAKGAE